MRGDKDEPLELDDKEEPKLPRRKKGFVPWVWVGVAVVVLLAASLVVIAMRRGGESGGPGAPGVSIKPESSDLEAYKAQLRAKVPFEVKKFADAGMKAESYVKDESVGHFKELTVALDPVTLTDKLTGKTARYTRAKFVRNDPEPYRAPRPGVPGRGGEVFAWASVELLP